MKSKVYLSKSKLADSYDIKYVRKYLQDLGYEIVEYQGGEYDPAPMLDCDLMVMVGYDKNEDDIMYVGKGQFDQLDYRESHGYDYILNLYFTQWINGDEDTPEFYTAESISVVNEDSWSKDYGKLQLIDEATIQSIVKEPMTKRTDPMTMEAVERMEEELPDEYKKIITDASPFHLACITLLS